MSADGLRGWNRSNAHHNQVLAMPPIEFTTTVEMPCIVCGQQIPAGTPALHKRRVGVAHVNCAPASWGTP